MGERLLDADIVELNLSVRSYNCLKRAGCSKVGDILERIENWQDLLKIRNLSMRSADEIIKNLRDYQTALLKEQGDSVIIRNAPKTEATSQKVENDDRDLSELGLSVRSYNSLRRAGYSKVGELKRDIKGGKNLRDIRNLGARSEKEIMLVLGFGDVTNQETITTVGIC